MTIYPTEHLEHSPPGLTFSMASVHFHIHHISQFCWSMDHPHLLFLQKFEGIKKKNYSKYTVIFNY